MKIIVTGSLGNISKPLTQKLIHKGHSVTVISSKQERQEEIEALGAAAAIGTMEDIDFLTETFKGADVVYAMEALNAGSFFDHSLDFVAANTLIGKNYKEAFERSGVKKIIHLSSIGAHMSSGNGILKAHYQIEQILNELPADFSIKFMRPTGFYYNMFAFIPTIKEQGAIIQNYGGDEKEPWVSPLDIAGTVAEEIEKPFHGREIRYIASDEVSPDEVAAVLGKAIGNNDLKWQVIQDQQLLDNLTNAGMNPETAKGFVEMNAARRDGILYEDYNQHKPVIGKVKLEDFATEFAKVYHQ